LPWFSLGLLQKTTNVGKSVDEDNVIIYFTTWPDYILNSVM
jgi:hypothetical protein